MPLGFCEAGSLPAAALVTLEHAAAPARLSGQGARSRSDATDPTRRRQEARSPFARRT